MSFYRYCWTAHDDFCTETLELRHNISVKFQISLTSAAGSGKLPRPDIMPEIENCIVNTCGGCPDAGRLSFESQRQKTYLGTCVPIQDSRSLIRISLGHIFYS